MKKWRKKYECKRGKGKHDWKPEKLRYFHWSLKFEEGEMDGIAYMSGEYKDLLGYKNKPIFSYQLTWICEACGKQDSEGMNFFGKSKTNKKFDNYRYKLYNSKPLDKNKE